MPKLDFMRFEARLATEPGGDALPPVETVTAADGTTLAIAVQQPAVRAKHVLVFVHGAGANMRCGYGILARAIAASGPIAVCLTDMRGHGASGGRRGHLARPDLAWRDVETVAVAMARRFPGAALHLGGHSSAAGLMVNAMAEGVVRVPVASLAFLAPHFGYHAALEHGDAQFGAARVWPFAVNWFSKGRFAGSVPAVELDFSGSPLARRVGCVSRYSVNMALAVTPSNPGPQLSGVVVPIWVGLAELDEVIDPEKTATFLARYARKAHVTRLEMATHLGILLDAGPSLAAAILAAA